MGKQVDISGQRFGRLVAIDRVSKGGGTYVRGESFWSCLCDCGSTTIVVQGNLRTGSIKSCGCLRRELLDKTTHGRSHLSEYSIWKNMLTRVSDPNCDKWEHYGGRGIKCDSRWQNFENFYADLGARPTGTTLGRIDNDGDYTPTNCRWETGEQQSNNKRTTRRLTFEGRTQSMSQWSRELGIPVETIFARLKRLSVAQSLLK